MEQDAEAARTMPERAEFRPASEEEIATNLSADTHFKGALSFERTLKIEGGFEGEISTTGTLLVGKNAEIKAEIKAKNAFVEGTITGNVTIEEKLYLRNSAKLLGDIKAGKLVVEEGAIVTGHCEVRCSQVPKNLNRHEEMEEDSYKVPIELNSTHMI